MLSARSLRRIVGSPNVRVSQPTCAYSSRDQVYTFSTVHALRLQPTTLNSADQRPQSTEGLEPKILKDSPPAKGSEPEDVRRHNEEMDKRADKAHEKMHDEDSNTGKAGKGKGQGEF